jgi:signal peptidase I
MKADGTIVGDSGPRRRRRWIRWILRQTERALALFGLAAIVYLVCFDLSRMTSSSMAPTLWSDDWSDGDLVLTEKVSYWFRQPRRWEVVAFRRPDGHQVMKRVVGLPGETVQLQPDGTIRIDGQPIDRPPELDSLKYYAYGNLALRLTAQCGDGYYVLGDDSRDSDDSRFNGAVRRDRLIGRAWLILAPAEHFGFVNVR